MYETGDSGPSRGSAADSSADGSMSSAADTVCGGDPGGKILSRGFAKVRLLVTAPHMLVEAFGTQNLAI